MKKESGRTMKIENHLPAGQVAGFLRALADELEGKNEGGLQGYGIDLQDFNKIKLGLRRGETGELFLKIKVKESAGRPTAAAPEKRQKRDDEDPGRLQYKILKKRMKANFATLGKALNAGALPDHSVVQSFLRDAKEMTAWPGYGDPFYDEFNRLCLAFAQADSGKDPARLTECYHDLAACMKSCHERYKR